MLTSDLVRARRSGGTLAPRFLDAKARPRLLEVARSYVEIFRSSVGRSREDVDQALDAVPVSSRDRVVADGLRKLCEDRAEFGAPAGLDPEAVRRELFLRSAEAHRALDARRRFEREGVVAAVAAHFGAEPAEVERAMFADLRSRQELTRFDPLPPEELLDRYDVSVVQALLLRATEVTLVFAPTDPEKARKLFRAARFHGLLHRVRRLESGEYEIVLDGPLSLFDAVQRYGIKLALFFPSVLELERFTLTAQVLYGPTRDRLTMTIDHETRLGRLATSGNEQRPEIGALVRTFRELGSRWQVEEAERIVALPGEAVCAPDLVFTHRDTGEEVLFELFGFWSRDAVFRRVELVRTGAVGRMILAVGKHLRVSEEVLGPDDAGEIYVYKTALSAKEILSRLDKRR